MKLVIGPSNGWLFANGIFSLRQQGKFLRRAGATAVEFCGTDDSRRKESLLSDEEPGEFQHVSLHLSDYDKSKPMLMQLSVAEKIVKRRNPVSCLIHPLEVPPEYWESLIARDIPVSIENMDKNKKSGYELKELKGLLTDFGLEFVLDVQHAFEHDSTMEYALDLFLTTKRRLVYLHVSGETENNNHALVHQSRNREAIIGFLGTVFSEVNVPIVLEGEYKNSYDVRREIKFLKQELA